MRTTITVFFTLLICHFNISAQDNAYSIRDIQIDTTFSTFDYDEFLEYAGLFQGVKFYPADSYKIIQKLEHYFIKRGYLFANIRLSQNILQNNKEVALSVSGNPGAPVYFGEIEIISDSIKTTNYLNLLNSKTNTPYSEDFLENDITAILNFAADSGFVFAQAEISDIKIQKKEDDFYARVLIKVEEGERAIVGQIHIKGNSYTKDRVILRELPVAKGEVFSKQKVDEIPRRLMRMGIFKNVKKPEIAINQKGENIINLVVEEGNATTFDGVIGFIPESNNTSNSDGYFTGLLDITFKNLFGTARKLDIHWEKPNQDSENFFLRYTEPWLMNYPFDVGAGLERTVRDSTYLEWKGDLGVRWRYNSNFSILSSIERQVVLPDSIANRNLRLVRYEQTNFEIGLEYDTRDYHINPREGIFFSNAFTFGFKNNFGPGYLFTEDSIRKHEDLDFLEVKFKWYREIVRNQVLALHFTGNQVTGNRLQLTDYTWFGGARSLRGYRENQFRGEITAWINLEYRFLTGRNSRIFAFNDWGAYRSRENNRKVEEVLTGYGIGIRLDTALGILAVDFGLGKGDSFSEGKIHFGILNRF